MTVATVVGLAMGRARTDGGGTAGGGLRSYEGRSATLLEMPEAGDVPGAPGPRSPASRRRKCRHLQSCDSLLDNVSPIGNERLLRHRRPHARDQETKELVIAGIRRNRFCRMLDASGLAKIFEAMEYFAFSAGETVVEQGDAGHRFFVAHEGVLLLLMNGQVINTLGRGTTFGGSALLYTCPLTTTVIAKEDAGVWGADGEIFHEVLREHAQRRYSENRWFLDQVQLFDGLDARQKERLCNISLYDEVFEAGARVVAEGEAGTAVYFVRTGELSSIEGGSIDKSGRLQGGRHRGKLRPGDCFGERAALCGEPRHSTVVADTRCELVCIGLRQLKEVLGQDFSACLQRRFVLSVLRRAGVMPQLSMGQQLQLVEAMEIRVCKAGSAVEEGMRLIVVIDGTVSALKATEQVTLQRGSWYADDVLVQVALEEGSEETNGSTSENALTDFSAGPEGATLAVMGSRDFARVLENIGCLVNGSAEQVMNSMRKMLLAKKVPIFSDLSEVQINLLIGASELKRYTEGEMVVRQGEVNSNFFVVARGHLSVLVDGCQVHTLQRGASFGERAMLFHERRTCSVVVLSQEAELWTVDRLGFEGAVGECMRGELAHHASLQDSSVSLKSLRHMRVLGVGTFGTVRLVEHTRTGVSLALKRIRKENGKVSPYVRQEAAILAEVDHPFVLRMVRTIETAHSFYLLTELVTGGALYDHLNRMGLLTRKQAQFYVGSLVLVLEALHQRRIVYRDLKPENVLLDERGYLKLIDFGLAKKFADMTDRTFTVAGTLHYMAPEVMTGQGYSSEADIWSLGVIFFELVCGRLPFGDHHDEEQDIVGAILEDSLIFPESYNDQAGRALMKGMLCKEPDQRLGVGLRGWEEIKSASYFRAGVSGNLFDRILGRELQPPTVPETEEYTDEAEFGEVSLSDADKLGGDAEYVLDNRWLKAQTAGLVYRSRKRLDDRDMCAEPLVWGTLVQGLEHGDGWLRVGNHFLPTRVNGIPVLTPQLYLVDNRLLQAPTAGLVYRRSKRLEDRDTSATTAHPLWGSVVAGVNEGDGWLRVLDRYLPLQVEGVQVLTPTLAGEVLPSRGGLAA